MCQFNIDHVFEVNFYDLKLKFPQTYQNIYIVVIFDIDDVDNLEDDYGWFAHPLYTKNGNFNVGDFNKFVWQLPVQYKTPFDFSKIKTLKEKAKVLYILDEAE